MIYQHEPFGVSNAPEKIIDLLVQRFRFKPIMSYINTSRVDSERDYIVKSIEEGHPILLGMEGNSISNGDVTGHIVLIQGYRIDKDNNIEFKINFGWGDEISTKQGKLDPNTWYPGNGAFNDILNNVQYDHFYVFKDTIPVVPPSSSITQPVTPPATPSIDFTACGNIPSDTSKPQATAIVLDHSGSMNEERKIDYARQAAFAYATNMEGDDLISVSLFSNTANTPAGLELQSKSDISAQWISNLVGTNPSGGTNIGAGLTKGLEQLCTVSGEKVKKGALLLSDGMNNVGSYDAVVEDYKKFHIPIYTVRFGNQASEQNLRNIAAATGGVYMDSNQQTVTGVYSSIYDAINGNSTITNSHDSMSPTGKLAYQVNVTPGADSLHVNTSWQGSRLKTVFTSPSGSTFSGEQLPGPTDHFEEGPINQYTQILNPESGRWKLDISWDEPPAVTERVNLRVSEHTDIYTSVLGFSPEYSAGQRVTINVHAAELDGGNNKIPLKNARVETKIQIPGPEVIRMIQAKSSNLRVYNDVAQDNTREVELFDDGAHDDYNAGDGIFGGFFKETQRNGAYIVTALIEGSKVNGGHISRRSIGSFQVGSLLDVEVTTSEIMQYARQLEEKMRGKVTNPLGGMQSTKPLVPAGDSTPNSKRKRSRSLMDSLSN